MPKVIHMIFNTRYYILVFILLATIEECFCATRFVKTLQQLPIELNVKEEEPIGSEVGILEATSDSNKPISYELSSEILHLLAIDNRTGVITNIARINAEDVVFVQFSAYAYSTPADKATTLISLIVDDINDNTPQFEKSSYNTVILENAAVGSLVIKVTAEDADFNDNIVYSFTTGDHPVFLIRYDGKVTTKANLDYETRKFYNINVTVSDNVHQNYTMLHIKVNDFDDQGPVFVKSVYNVELREGSYPVRTFLTEVHAYDLDFGINASVTYIVVQEKQQTTVLPVTQNQFLEEGFGLWFANIGSAQLSVNEVTGEVYLAGIVDRENASIMNIHISAESTNHPAAQTIVRLKVIDVNDNKPMFTQASFIGQVNENSVDGTQILRVTAFDRDDGNNSALQFRITNVESLPFKITPEGEIQVDGLLDRETRDIYVIKVHVEEKYTVEKYNAVTSVLINVIDTNDNTPEFPDQEVKLNVFENRDPPVHLMKFIATDKDSGSNADLIYTIASPQSDFQLDSITGDLTIVKALDREVISNYNFQVEVSDMAQIGQRRSSTVAVSILVYDENDNTPLFEKDTYESFIIEAVTPNTIVSTVMANDPDFESNGEVKYTIVAGQNNTFTIHPYSGVIRTSDYLDRETQNHYNLTIRATDGGKKSSTCYVLVHVLDSNDNRPVFENQGRYTFNVALMCILGKYRYAFDADQGQAGLVTYSVLDNNLFQVNKTTGDVYTLHALDREKNDVHIFTVVATDSVIDYRNGYGQVRVNVIDMNDNAPVFKKKEYSLVIQKATQPNTVIHTVHATDNDLGRNAEITYKSSDLPGFLSLNGSSGELKLSSRIPTSPSSLLIHIVACNTLNPNFNDTVVVSLFFQSTIVDAPKFQHDVIVVSVVEEEPAGAFVTDLNSTYLDRTEDVDFRYAIRHGAVDKFSLNQQTGVLKTAAILDREDMSQYLLVVSVSLKDQESSNFATLKINVQDKNDNTPFFLNTWTKLHVRENDVMLSPPPLIQCMDKDVGNNARVTYSIEGNVPLSIDVSTGEINLKNALDYETLQEFNTTVKCTNSFSATHLSALKTIQVIVQDENDNVPTFAKLSYNVNITENNNANIDLITINAIDDDHELNGRLHYKIGSITPSSTCFAINSRTGLIRLECVLDREEHEMYQLQIKASDSGAPSLSSYVNLAVQVMDENDNKPVMDNTRYAFSISENAPPSVVGRLGITDRDSYAPCEHCVIYSGNEQGLFEIAEDGRLLTLKQLDREANSSHWLILRVYHVDEWDLSFSTISNTTEYIECTIEIIVRDENDNAPYFPETKMFIGVHDASPYGTLITTVSAIDYDEQPGVLYNITSGNDDHLFTINSKTGEIKTTFRLLHIQTMRTLTVTARDNNGESISLLSPNHASINVLIFDDSSIGSFATTVHPSYIETHTDELERLLSNLTKAHAKVHEVLPTSQSSVAKVTFYAIDVTKQKMLSTKQLTNSLLENLLQSWNISSVGVSTAQPIIQETDNERDLLIGIILGISIVVVLLIVLSIYLWFRGGRRTRKGRQPSSNLINSRIPKPQPSIDANGNRYYLETYESTDMYDTVRYHASGQEFPPQSFFSAYEAQEEEGQESNGAPNNAMKNPTSWAYGNDAVDNENADEIGKEKVKSQEVDTQKNGVNNDVKDPVISTAL